MRSILAEFGGWQLALAGDFADGFFDFVHGECREGEYWLEWSVKEDELSLYKWNHLDEGNLWLSPTCGNNDYNYVHRANATMWGMTFNRRIISDKSTCQYLLNTQTISLVPACFWYDRAAGIIAYGYLNQWDVEILSRVLRGILLALRNWFDIGKWLMPP